MLAHDLTDMDPADLAPIPDVPTSFGPRNAEEQRVLALVMQGLSSGPMFALADDFFAEIDAIIAQ